MDDAARLEALKPSGPEAVFFSVEAWLRSTGPPTEDSDLEQQEFNIKQQHIAQKVRNRIRKKTRLLARVAILLVGIVECWGGLAL